MNKYSYYDDDGSSSEEDQEQQEEAQQQNVGLETTEGSVDLDEKDLNTNTEEKNDDLLYNDKEDDDNIKWMTQKLGLSTKTDAVLNCPCCFTLLCADCQQHERYENQFRAMFVSNCFVDFSQVMKYKGEADAVTDSNGDEVYHPVKCKNCGVEVGVYDLDEVYHFFNVFPSS
eukprot:TRINITY_DN2990_c0_g1_i1.p1 TRINITY_DN2990_c0_g1~~TRINITY_DN2990_c0_g1_i1.p1  ORF type:complete len:172 (-),score=50.36 TRINITY_DN2990_c0_g1_i1:22-537(-)